MTLANLSPKQKALMKWAFAPDTKERYKAVICDGAVRSGKTVCMIVAFVLWAMDGFSGKNFGICGKTVQSAERNILQPLEQSADIGRFFSLRYVRSTKLLTVTGPGGKANYFYIFGGKDESSYTLIQGITLSGVLFDEVALMPQSFVEQAIARTLSEPAAKLWFNCNPENPNHYFYRDWIIPADRGERNALHLHFLMTDNPILTEQAIREAEAMYTGVFRDRYIKGLWVAAEGRVYDMFDSARHVLQALPETAGDYYVSCDYGTQNPTVFLLWRKERGTDRWICLREYYYSGREKKRQKTDGEYAGDLTAWLGDVNPRAVIVDPSAASFIALLRQRGYPVQKADNEVLDGIRLVGQLLQEGRLAFSRGCVRTLEEFQAYVWDEKSSALGLDKPVKENDHAMDAVRYFVSTILRRNQARVGHRPRRL